jgi:hypothetical protein
MQYFGLGEAKSVSFFYGGRVGIAKIFTIPPPFDIDHFNFASGFVTGDFIK